jgi:hypothetical protein
MAITPYPDDVIEKALTLAATIGIRPASRELQIPHQTISAWTSKPAWSERWADLRKHDAPKWRERAAATLEELVDGYTAIEVAALERAQQALGELEPRDVGTFVRSIATAKGITAEHVAKLRGQPDKVVEHRYDADKLESAMAKLLESVAGEAEEITDAVEALPAPPEETGPE